VETTPATTQDDQVLPIVHTALAARDLLPRLRATVDALVAHFLPVAPWDLE